jgi:hypothetical protein
MTSKTRQSLASPDIQFGEAKLDRLMQHIRALTTEVQRLQQLLAGGSVAQVLQKTGTGDYQGAWGSGAGGALITGAKNLGAGLGLYTSVSGTLIELKSLLAGSNITLSAGANTLTISAPASGSGTVTSIGFTSTDLLISGPNPIVGAGIIELEIAPNAVSYAKMQPLSADALFLGRRKGDGVGNPEELSGSDALAILNIVGGYPKQLAYAGIL